jgi:hypothetical protein
LPSGATGHEKRSAPCRQTLEAAATAFLAAPLHRGNPIQNYDPLTSLPLFRLARRCGVGREFNILALAKGNEHYVYIFDDDSHQALLDALQSQAGDGQLSLNFFDAAVLSRKAHEQTQAAQAVTETSSRF